MMTSVNLSWFNVYLSSILHVIIVCIVEYVLE